ncbi:MAG: ferrous iron transport protein A [Planctomycetales bacterium]|nr:ferrous iron transport protein A [Planctomycetales bacterium]
MIAPGRCETIVPIELLRSNENASVVELSGDEQQIHRLSEMGLRVGTVIRMVRPGAPCLLALGSKRLSIRLGKDVDILVATP